MQWGMLELDETCAVRLTSIPCPDSKQACELNSCCGILWLRVYPSLKRNDVAEMRRTRRGRQRVCETEP